MKGRMNRFASIFIVLLALSGVSFAQEEVYEALAVETPASEQGTGTVSEPAVQKPATLSNEQVARLIGPRQNPYPRFFPGGAFLRLSFAPSDGVDVGMGFLFPLSRSWPVSVGFEPFHLQIGAKDFQVVSDETVWIAAAGLILGSMGPLFSGEASKAPAEEAPKKESKGSVAKTILAITALVPLYAICGSLYIPVVPGSWLGISDRSRLNTQLISEGFHKRSFTYINDVGLRLSPLASTDGVLHAFVDGGIRFEKNFDADLKYRYFAQLGASLNF